MIPLIYIGAVLLHALWHWYLITKKNRTIKSVQKLIEWGAVVIIMCWIFPLWSTVIFGFVTRLAFFDIVLNLMRGKSIFYEGVISKKKSFVDWVENKIGLPTWVFRIVYLAAFITLLIIYYA